MRVRAALPWICSSLVHNLPLAVSPALDRNPIAFNFLFQGQICTNKQGLFIIIKKSNAVRCNKFCGLLCKNKMCGKNLVVHSALPRSLDSLIIKRQRSSLLPKRVQFSGDNVK